MLKFPVTLLLPGGYPSGRFYPLLFIPAVPVMFFLLRSASRRLSPFACVRLVGGFLASVASVHAQPLAPAEALSALRAAEKAAAQPGTFRTQSTQTLKHGTVSTTRITQRAPDGNAFARVERITTVNEHPDRTRTRLTLTNLDGTWEIIGQHAVLIPNPFRAKLDALRGKTSGTPGSAANAGEPNAELKALESHLHYEGECYLENGQPMLRVTRSYDEEARKVLGDVIEEQVAQAKKRLSFAKRMLVSTFLATQGGIAGLLPAREIFTIDPTKNRLVRTETFNARGKRMSAQETGADPERIEPVAATTFALPANAVIHRPGTMIEYSELLDKLRGDEKKLDEATPEKNEAS